MAISKVYCIGARRYILIQYTLANSRIHQGRLSSLVFTKSLYESIHVFSPKGQVSIGDPYTDLAERLMNRNK